MTYPRRDMFNQGWQPLAAAQETLELAIAEYDPSHVFGLFSGGHDSLVSTHIVAQHPRFSGAVTIYTGIGVRATRRYVHSVCRQFDWPLRAYRPRKGDRYHEMVEEFGFPGRSQHKWSYIRLKQRSVERLVADHKTHAKDRILLVTGVRAAESTRRMGHVKPVDRTGAQVWVAPIIDWDHRDKAEYMAAHQLPENEVVQLLHRSGECNCGAYAQPWELDELRLWYPDDAENIDILAAKVRERFSWGWGQQPPPTAYPDNPNQVALQLCTSCEGRQP